jgi:hypothetical protein
MTEHGRASLLAAHLSLALPDTFTVRCYGAEVYVSDRATDALLLSVSAYAARDWCIRTEEGDYSTEYGTPRQVSDRLVLTLGF